MIGGNLLAHDELHFLGRCVDALVCLGQSQLRGVLLVYLEYYIAQTYARFVGYTIGRYLQVDVKFILSLCIYFDLYFYILFDTLQQLSLSRTDRTDSQRAIDPQMLRSSSLGRTNIQTHIYLVETILYTEQMIYDRQLQLAIDAYVFMHAYIVALYACSQKENTMRYFLLVF